jgi:hypothetical protein
MKREIEELPNWTFQVEEMSAGIYRLRAKHRLGPSIESTGIDPEELMERARKDAAEMERRLEPKEPVIGLKSFFHGTFL